MWLDEVNSKRKEYWNKNYSYKEYTPLEVRRGQKYMKLIDEGSVWAFVSMVEGVNKGSLVCKGDLLKPAGWNTPAKHSRGNIFDGSAKWDYNGPAYLK
jgi:hypothetical protein